MSKSDSSSGPMWGCIGTVGAALVTGVFGVITVLVANPTILSEYFGIGTPKPTNPPAVIAQSTDTPTPALPTVDLEDYIFESPTPDLLNPIRTPSLPEIDWAELFGIDDVTPEAPLVDDFVANLGAAPLATSTCPFDTRTQWLVLPGTWYGPYDIYWISYDLSNFYVWDPNLWNPVTGLNGNWYYYSSLPIASARNVWHPLPGTAFWVCIDSAGYVHSVYGPG